MHAIGRQAQRVADGARSAKSYCPEQATLYRVVQQHAANSVANTEPSAGPEQPRFIKHEFDVFLECDPDARLPEATVRRACAMCRRPTSSDSARPSHSRWTPSSPHAAARRPR